MHKPGPAHLSLIPLISLAGTFTSLVHIFAISNSFTVCWVLHVGVKLCVFSSSQRLASGTGRSSATPVLSRSGLQPLRSLAALAVALRSSIAPAPDLHIGRLRSDSLGSDPFGSICSLVQRSAAPVLGRSDPWLLRSSYALVFSRFGPWPLWWSR